MNSLITALSLQDASGRDVSLMQNPARRVTKATGLAALTAREVVRARTGRQGSKILTHYRTDAQITIEGVLVGVDATETWAHCDTVAGVLAGAVTTERLLKWTLGSGLALQRLVRLVSLDAPLEPGPDIIRYQAMLRAPDPNAYSQTLQTRVSVPLGATGGGGLTAPFTAPILFHSPAQTVASFTNAGFVPTPPVFELDGYLLNPIIELAPGIEMVFSGAIAAGDTLTVDVDARTVLLNGDPNANRRYMLNTPASTWFELPPGSGTLTLLASDFDTNAQLTVSWRDARN